MKKTFGIIALAALVMLASCKKNEQTTGTKLTAGIEQNKSNSKTSLNDLTITWSAGDQLYVNNGTAAACFTLTSNPGATSGEFATTGEYTFTDENVAVYPYNENITVGNNKVTMTLPAVQTASTSGTFGNGANPMLGVFANPANIQLTSLCGVLCLQLTGDNVEITDIKIEGGADDKLNGTFEADYTATSPVLAKTGDDGTNAVTLHLQETTTLTTTAQKFYVVLPAVTLTNGFTMKVYNGTNEIFSQSTTASLNIPVNTVESMNALEVVPFNPYTTPLTFEARTDGVSVGVNNAFGINLQYSTDGVNWNDYSSAITLTHAGDIVSFRGNNTSFNSKKFTCSDNCYIYGNVMSLLHAGDYATNYALSEDALVYLFSENINIDIHPYKDLVLPATQLAEFCYQSMFSGCTGLTKAPALPAETMANYCYTRMFEGCEGLQTAPALPAMTLATNCYQHMFSGCTGLHTAPALPATNLAQGCYANMFSHCTSLNTVPNLLATVLADGCYGGMFEGCTGLTTAPTLPVTTLAGGCYASMFSDCTNLTEAPTLPATTLAEECYAFMFSGCTGLTTAPELPATTMVKQCYYYMFYGCTSLNSITCLATSGFGSLGCTEEWVTNVASSGTFTKASGVTSWTTGNNGIPSGWTVVNYGSPATVLVTGITLNKTETTLTVGETETLSVASVQPTNATNQTVTWSSDNTGVATVDATTGEVTAVAAGTATITATANDGSNVTATCAVTVNAPAPVIPEGIVNGLYSVSATKQVWFSKGNLQYQVPTGNWRFAEHQWDYCQTSNGAWNNSNWIDYFTWGTWTGSNPNPTQTSNIDESIYTFAATDFDQTLHGSDAWRTLTIEEWYCLFYERASGATVTTTSGTTNNARFAKATINTDGTGVNGIILFPDGVTIASNEATTWGTINDRENEWGTKCTSAQWTDLEYKGCVFLPAAGDHHGDGNSPVTAFVVGTWGFYWSSSNMSAQEGYCVYFYKEDMRPKPTNTYYSSWHSTGMCVRLVQDYN